MAGFALVLVVLLIALSALAAAAVEAFRAPLQRRGPHAERRAVELAAVAPLALALSVVTALVVYSYVGADHCVAHDHHAHLCTAHGGGWAERPWVVAVLAAAAAGCLVRVLVLAARVARAAGAIGRLRRLSTPAGDVHIVDSPHAFCFVAGLRRPAIFTSTTAWRGLAPDERDAMLAHERGHVAHRDLSRRFGLDVLLAFAAPLVAARLLARWSHATERLRDADAAEAMGDPDPVARAMLRLCRLERGVAPPGLAFTGRGQLLTERIEALLAAPPAGHGAARFLAIAALVTVGGLVALAAGLAGPLHHAFETLLG